MNYNNRLYPHPVLGIRDDITGEFSCELIYQSDKNSIKLSPVIKLIEERLQQFILEGKAYFLTQVYCRSTMFRETYKSSSTLQSIVIPAFKLNSSVEVDFFICSSSNIDKYSSTNFNAEYNKTKFFIEKSDILAYGGKGKFVANKSPEELRSVSSLIRIDCTGKKGKLMFNEYDGEKISIMLCKEDYENYQAAIRNKVSVNFIHGAIVLPALIDALYFIEKGNNEECHQLRWFKALKEIKDKSKDPDCFKIAQNILGGPNERVFDSILFIIENSIYIQS